jgi:hypothetical protein
MSDHKPDPEPHAQQTSFSNTPVQRLDEAIESAKRGAEAATGSKDALGIVEKNRTPYQALPRRHR